MNLYVVVRKSLDMSVGKVAAQVAHAVKLVLLAEVESTRARVRDWRGSEREAIVVLGADEVQWAKVMAMSPFVQRDRGFTEVEPETSTVAAFAPMDPTERPKLLARLRLLTSPDQSKVGGG